MKKHRFTEEQWANAKLRQASLAISGYRISDEDLAEYLGEVVSERHPKALERLVEKAHREGRSASDVLREYYTLATPPQDDQN